MTANFATDDRIARYLAGVSPMFREEATRLTAAVVGAKTFGEYVMAQYALEDVPGIDTLPYYLRENFGKRLEREFRAALPPITPLNRTSAQA